MTSLFPTDLFPLGSEDLFDNFFGSQEELSEMFTEYRRRYLTLLQHEGTPCRLLQKKTSGDRCTYWSEESQQCSKPLTVPKCFNTGWIGGYEAPVDILVRFVSPGSTLSWYNQGVRVNKELRCWSIWRPLLKNWDVIVKTQTGERYFIEEITQIPPWRKDMFLFQEFDVKLVTSEPVRFFGTAEGLTL